MILAAATRWTRRLGGPRLAGAILLDALGSGTTIPLGVLFFTIHEHMAPTTVGLGLSIGGAVSLIFTPLGGHLIDVLGPKRSLVGAWVISAAAAASWVLVHGLLSLAVVQSVGAMAGGIGWTSTAALLAAQTREEELPEAMATQYSLKNFGFGAGGLLSTLALAGGGVGFELAAFADAASFLLGAALAVSVAAPSRPRSPREDDPTTVWTVLTDWRYVSLSLLNALLAFNQVGLSVVLPLWVVQRTHAPREVVGLLFTLNTLLVVSGQLLVSRSVRDLSDTPRAYRRAAVVMLVAAGAYVGAHYVGPLAAVALLAVGTILLTGTEMLSSACAFLVSLRLAQPDHRGKYLSVFGLGWGVENTVGPSAGTALLGGALVLPWAAITVVVALGAAGSSLLIRGRAPTPGPGSEAEQSGLAVPRAGTPT